MGKYTLYHEEAVLIIIDIQERFIPVMTYAEQIITNTITLIKTAEKLKIPILVTEQYPKGLGKTVPSIQENISEATFFEKMTFSSCIPELIEHLKKLNRRKILIVGMETQVCVFQTVRDLLEMGYEVFAVSDAICSRTKPNYRNALTMMLDMGAVITNTETVFFDLLKQAGTPEFKELSSKYIK